MEVQQATEQAEVPKDDTLDNPELNKAAYIFKTGMPRIKALAKNLSGKGVARVFNAIIEFPFSETTPRFKNKAENELFVLTLNALGAKSIMSAAIMKHREEIEHEVVNEIISNKEDTNG